MEPINRSEAFFRLIHNEAEWRAVCEIRHQVFVLEQGIPKELDQDGKDAISQHLIAILSDGSVVGTGRISPTDLKEAVLSRIAIRKDFRGIGIGKKLIEALEKQALSMGYNTLRLSPHLYLKSFYAKLGYVQESPEEYSVGPHSLIEMVKRVG